MNNDRHLTHAPRMPFMPAYVACVVGTFLVREWTQPVNTRGDTTLIWVGFYLGLFIILLLINHLFWPSHIVLTEEGVETKNWAKKSQTSWGDVIQVVAMDYENDRVLALIKAGGVQLKENGNADWFIFRNFRKRILLPDDKFTRAFVEKYYGPLDFDLSERE